MAKPKTQRQAILESISADPGIVKMPDGVTEFRLNHPLRIGSETIELLKLKPMTGKVMRRGDCGPDSQDAVLNTAAQLSGQSPIVFDEMQAEDVNRLSSLVMSFFVPGQPDGLSA
jgi:hypothetical protein